MEQRLASNTWRLTLNERKFIETALASDLRIDGRRPFDHRNLTIHFGKEYGSSEVHLGETHVMGYVTAQLVQPYRDRPNEGTLSIFTEFSPMADPSFEPGRPGEFAIELGRVIDRGLRESKAIDMESLCVVAGKSVWAIRLDLHILDNGGNLIDAANIAALAALLTFRRPDCTLGGENNQEVIIHDPEVREPLPLIIHHLPVAVTFAIFGEGNTMVIDPAYKEEAVMGGRLTATLNSNGDVCAIQKAGGEGLITNVIMQCLRIASMKATEISEKIKNTADEWNMERALQKVKRHQSSKGGVIVREIVRQDNWSESLENEKQMLQNEPVRAHDQVDDMAIETSTSLEVKISGSSTTAFVGGSSNWDPYPTETFLTVIRRTEVVPGPLAVDGKEEISRIPDKSDHKQATNQIFSSNRTIGAPGMTQQTSGTKSLKDAVKLKGKKRK